MDSENSKRVRRAGGMSLIENTITQHEVLTWWSCIFLLSLCCRCIVPDGGRWRWGTRENEHRYGTWASSRWDWNPSKYSMLRSKCYISCSWTVQLSDFLIRWDQSHHKRPSPLDALLWATHKRLLITAQRSPCGALTFQHVWFPPFSRKSQQGCVPPAGVVGANGSRLRGIPSLWTLPRIWRYSGGPEWLLPTGHPAQIRAGRPPLSWCAFHIKTLWKLYAYLFATRCWFRVSKTVF